MEFTIVKNLYFINSEFTLAQNFSQYNFNPKFTLTEIK